MSELPNLVIAGVEKAGTTSLFFYLSQHPEICASHVKEINYFFPRGCMNGELEPIAEYAKQYAHHRGEPYRLEASPSYWYGGTPVILAMRQTLDRPRILVSLREPVSRFWSAYTFLKSMARLDKALTVDEYIAECQGIERQQEGPPERTHHTPLSIGLYHEYLLPWLGAFGQDLKVVFAESLFAQPRAVVSDLCGWLAIDGAAADRLDYQARNETIRPRSYALAKVADLAKERLNKRLWQSTTARRVLRDAYRAVNSGGQTETLEPQVRERLEAFYSQSNALLAAELTSRGYTKLPAWLSPGVR
ncbi:MAG: sulfotransferase domain-containing protein [Egibacteraceae bacterium]